MTYLPRAMTSGELALIRKDRQFSTLYMAIYKPPTVYTAMVNQTFTTSDMVVQITYDTGVGTLANVLPGMTMYIGTTPGANDLGQCRIRKTPTATIFYIGEISDIAWADNLYLTVVDNMNLWPRHIKLDVNNVPYMDVDIAYTNQHTNCNPVPVLGPRYVPVWLLSSTVVVPFDASDSWVVNSTITGYSWAAPGAFATSGLTTATPSITYNAVGTYRVACTLTAANGTTTTGYVYIQVFDRVSNLPITAFDLKSADGSWSKGGWSTKVTMYSQADFSTVVDRALCVVFARDFYDGTEQSLSPIAGRENIITVGWIDGESITIDPEKASVEFTVEGAQAWLDKITGFPIGIQNYVKTADAWTNFTALTVDASLWHMFYWQSTVIPVIDVYPTGDTRISAEQSVPGEMSLWQQLSYLATNTILSRALADRHSRLFIEVDTDIMPVASRSTIPTVMPFGYTDWREKAQVTRYIVSPTGKVASSGVAISSGNAPFSYFSLSPGHVFKRYGKSLKQDKLLLASQAQSNELSGALLAKDNKIFDVQFDLAGNNRMVDIVPRQRIAWSMVAGDSPRGFSFSGNLLVREINMSFNSSGKIIDDNFLQITWQAEPETTPENNVNGDIPLSTGNSTFPPLVLPPLPPAPPMITPSNNLSSNVAVVSNSLGVWYTNNFNAPTNKQQWFSWNAGLNPSDLNNVVNFEISLISGRGYLQIGNSAVYSSPGVGQPWALVLDITGLTAMYVAAYGAIPGGASSILIIGMGINRMASDELMLLCKRNDTFPAGSQIMKANFFYGTSAGVTMGIELEAATGVGNFIGYWMSGQAPITYGSNRWTAYVAVYNNRTFTINRTGSALIASFATAYNGSPTRMSTRGNVDGANWFLWDSGGSPGTNIRVSNDNGLTFSAVTTPPQAPYGGQNYQSLDADPTGLYVMVGQSVTPQKSSDGGVTWSNAGLSGSYGAFWGVSSLIFIASGATSVYSTEDFGVTWIERTGDLSARLGYTGWSVRLIRSF